MPRFDKTGPSGDGPRTGRGMGNCNSNQKRDENKLEDTENDNLNSANKTFYRDNSNNRKFHNRNR